MSKNERNNLKVKQTKKNFVVGLSLLGFVIIVFAVTIVKMSDGHLMEAFDHGVRPSLIESEPLNTQ